MRRSRPKSSILLSSGVKTLLLQHSVVARVCGFVLHRPPSAPSSIAASSEAGRARAQLSLANAKRSSGDDGDNDYDYTDGMADSALHKDLQIRIQELGLDGESTRSDDDGGARSGGALAPDVEIDEEKEYVYIGGERFYMPSASVTSSSSRSAPSVDRGEQYLEYLPPPSEYRSSNGAVSSRRELIDEARPSIIGSLEGLALAISLFFVVTVAATGGSLFASNANISTGSTVVSHRIILDPDTLLKEDFARDGSSVFYGQTVEE